MAATIKLEETISGNQEMDEAIRSSQRRVQSLQASDDRDTWEMARITFAMRHLEEYGEVIQPRVSTCATAAHPHCQPAGCYGRKGAAHLHPVTRKKSGG